MSWTVGPLGPLGPLCLRLLSKSVDGIRGRPATSVTTLRNTTGRAHAELVAESAQGTAAHSAELARRLARGEDLKRTKHTPRNLSCSTPCLYGSLDNKSCFHDQHRVEPKHARLRTPKVYLCHVAAAAACSAARRSACACIPTDPPRSSNSAQLMTKIPTTTTIFLLPERKPETKALCTCSGSTGPAALPGQRSQDAGPLGHARQDLDCLLNTVGLQ